MALQLNRRHFLSKLGMGIGGAAALTSLLPGCGQQIYRTGSNISNCLLADFKKPHIAPKAKRVIYLFQSGSPSQMDLFDYKPLMHKASWSGTPGFC